jgi:hypothetical protein
MTDRGIVPNEHSRGLGLRQSFPSAAPVQVGEIFATQMPNRGAAKVCLVLRAGSNKSRHLDVGPYQQEPVPACAVYARWEADHAAPEPLLFLSRLPLFRKAAAVAAARNRFQVIDPLDVRHRCRWRSLRGAR